MVVVGVLGMLLGWFLAILSTVPPLAGRGVIIAAYGLIIGGIIALWRGIMVLRHCPDRRLPGCRGPDGKIEQHDPERY